MSAAEYLQAPTGKDIRSRVMVCSGLCAIARSEVHAMQIERASGTLAAIRQILQETNLLIAEPCNLPGDQVRDLKDMVDELDRLTWDIGRAILRAKV